MILLTGGTGFIGRHVLPELIRQSGEREIAVLVHREMLPSLSSSRVHIVSGGLDSLNEQARCLPPVSCIIHLAGKNRDVDNTGFDHVNVEGMRHIIRLAGSMHVEKLIYISSTGVYGHGSFYQATELTEKVPDTPFSKSKFEAERLLKQASLPAIVLRHRFVIGAGDRYVVPSFVRVIKQMPFLPGAGKPLASFVDVEDMARIIVHMALHAQLSSSYEEFHVTNGEEISIAGVLETLSCLLPVHGRPKFPLPFLPMYSLLRMREKLTGKNADSHDANGLTSLRLAFLGRNNHFSNSKLCGTMPGFKFRSFRDSVDNAKNYYRSFV